MFPPSCTQRLPVSYTHLDVYKRQTLYRVFIYVALITLAVTIIVPVAWVFMASVKQNSEFYGNPWTCLLYTSGLYLCGEALLQFGGYLRLAGVPSGHGAAGHHPVRRTALG